MNNFDTLRYFLHLLKQVPEKCGKCNNTCEHCLYVYKRKCEILDNFQEHFVYEFKDYNGALCGFKFVDETIK